MREEGEDMDRRLIELLDEREHWSMWEANRRDDMKFP